jgi:hypothetical protein
MPATVESNEVGVMNAVQAIATEEAMRHRNNVAHALDAAIQRVRDLPNYDDLVDALVLEAVRERVYDARHQDCRAIRKAAGEYCGPAKVTAGATSNDVAFGVYCYMIDGRTLGTIRGDELAVIADGEEARAHGHRFNARLCRKLLDHVSEDKTVRQCLKETALREIFASIK